MFANADKADAAREAGADFVGGDELIEKVNGGWLDFDAVVATPDMMGKVGRLGRVLGPRSLMPNPKTGTVTADVAKAVSDIKGGKIEFRVDRHANLHFIIGKASFSEAQLAENYAAALEEVLRLKPASSKGRYIKKVTVSTTMGPGVQVDPNRTKNVAARTRPRPEQRSIRSSTPVIQTAGASSRPGGGWEDGCACGRRHAGSVTGTAGWTPDTTTDEGAHHGPPVPLPPTRRRLPAHDSRPDAPPRAATTTAPRRPTSHRAASRPRSRRRRTRATSESSEASGDLEEL